MRGEELAIIVAFRDQIFPSSYAKIARMSQVAANAAKKIGVTLACNPLVPWWAILGSNQWPLPCEGNALPLS
jgi:hypothetical protein